MDVEFQQAECIVQEEGVYRVAKTVVNMAVGSREASESEGSNTVTYSRPAPVTYSGSQP